MAGTPFVDGPSAFAAAAADIYVPASALVYALVRQIHIANATGSQQTFNLYVGATGGSANGTELAEGKAIAANDVADLYFPSGLKLVSTTFLTGFASVTTVIVTVIGELYAT
jgi:hypothetical protein